MLKTYHGSCHCGAVRFEADLDLGLGTLRCNCSICHKGRFWSVVVKPEGFRLQAGAGDLTLYQFHSMKDEHFLCQRCGIRAFGTGDSPRWGRFYAISVTCLDDASDEELANAPITFLDGRNDQWLAPPSHGVSADNRTRADP